MPISTRLLLGGFYGAALLSLLLPFPSHRGIALPWEHGAQFFFQTYRFPLALALSLMLNILAIVFTRQRVLVLAAAAVNAFYALGGLAFAAWLFVMPGGFGRLDPQDPYIFLCVMFVPAVAAMSFYGAYSAGASNNRWRGP
jgi:hypothetical protein